MCSAKLPRSAPFFHEGGTQATVKLGNRASC